MFKPEISMIAYRAGNTSVVVHKENGTWYKIFHHKDRVAVDPPRHAEFGYYAPHEIERFLENWRLQKERGFQPDAKTLKRIQERRPLTRTVETEHGKRKLKVVFGKTGELESVTEFYLRTPPITIELAGLLQHALKHHEKDFKNANARSQ